MLVDPKRRTFEVYRGADVIKPNAGELSAATGLPCATDQDLEAAALELTKQFAGTLVVTRGEAGLSLFSPGQPVRHITTAAQEVADVSGAGDTALAALAVAMAEGLSIDDAAVISNFVWSSSTYQSTSTTPSVFLNKSRIWPASAMRAWSSRPRV